jgi:hypothetical protein
VSALTFIERTNLEKVFQMGDKKYVVRARAPKLTEFMDAVNSKLAWRERPNNSLQRTPLPLSFVVRQRRECRE